MADQTVRIQNLDSASEARVAYDMATRLSQHLPAKGEGLERIAQFLQLYAACRMVSAGGNAPVSLDKLK